VNPTWPRVVERADATVLWSDPATVATFDLEGRPVSWWREGRLCKRSLASEVHERVRAAGRRVRRRLPEDEARREFEGLLRDVRRAVRPDTAVDRLETVLRWTAEGWMAERDRFRRAYRPVAILPPDAYLAIVVQLTTGCTWNRCTFCEFYQDRRFAALDRLALAAHLDAVAALLGRGAALRRSLFLADGNALALSDARLIRALSAARERFPGRPVAGFADVLTGARRSPAAWAALSRAGLRRIHVGVESGHDPLLAWMDKPQDAAAAVAFVRDVKDAGLEVAPIVLAGAGGARWAEAHVRDTVAAIAALPLRAGDRVYVSPFVEHPGSEYARRAREDAVEPLPAEAIEAQLRDLRRGIAAAHPGIPVARYDLAEFLY